MDRRNILDCLILLLLIVCIALLVVNINTYNNDKEKCTTNPLKYIENKTGTNCYCYKIDDNVRELKIK